MATENACPNADLEVLIISVYHYLSVHREANMAMNKAVKLDETTYDRLKALGETRQRTPHWLMREAIKQFLEREEEAERRKKDTLERIARFEETGKSIPFEAIDEWLASWGSESEGKCPISAA